MQVADPKQLTTSATLGGEQAISFGISEDPAFFQILSSSLYNNPNLAVVRETICNSWDAHIEAGLKHVPILITLDKDGFISFRDYGKGIPTDKIGQVYGTYGASTKKSDTSTTGGFGLGCKSPFAYTDSFQVTSMNQGKKSIYNVTKSSIETGGKPGIIPIITEVDTDETGLEVKFQIKENDVNEFVRYIGSIVFNGEIKAILRRDVLVEPGKTEVRDVELATLGMSFEPGSYDFSSRWYMNHMGNHAVYVRYGNVMYPATQSFATEKALELIHNFMSIIGATRIVVQAAPSTLAIAPSRETLSNQKMTDDGITDICVELVDKLEEECKAGIPNAITEIENGIKADTSYSWWHYPDFLDFVSNRTVRRYMNSSLWAKQRVHHQKHWQNMYIRRFFEQPIFKGFNWNQAKANKALRNSINRGNDNYFGEFLQRYAVLPVLAKWAIAGYKFSGYILPSGQRGCRLFKGSIIRLMSCNTDTGILGLLKTKNVIITKRMSDCDESFDFYPDYYGEKWNEDCLKNPGHNLNKAALVIHVGPKAADAEAAVLKWSALGYRVIDLTQEHDWDLPGKQRRDIAKAAAEVRARKKQALLDAGMKGSEPNRLISINCLIQPHNFYNQESKIVTIPWIAYEFAAPEAWKKYNHVDVKEPVYYVTQQDIHSGKIGDNPKIASMHRWNDLTDEIRAVTVICRNKTEVNKATKRGAVHLDDRRYKELFGVINTKEFEKYVTEERLGLLEEISMDVNQWKKLLQLLGLKHKVLDSMVDRPEFNWAYNFIATNSHKNCSKLVQMGLMTSLDGLAEYKELTRLSSFKHLQALHDLKGIFYSNDVGGPLYGTSLDYLVNWLEKHPEDAQAYKALIRNAITKRKGIYTR